MTDKLLTDDDYVLTEGAAWFAVGGFSIRVHKTDEGVICDIYQTGCETNEAIVSCYAYDNELEPIGE